jgi:rSAM/selenodomain-associated transferase 1
MTTTVVIMAKKPISGSSKTRLVPAVGSEAAAELALRFLLDAADVVRSLPDTHPAVATWPPGSEQFFATTLPDFQLVAQTGDSLAERLAGVMTDRLDDYKQVFAINADSPSLPAGHVLQAMDLLAQDSVDVVFGPSEDGGYYLVGWKRAHPQIITQVQMSTPNVLADSLDLAEALDLRVALAPVWFDVDEPEDLARLRADTDAGTVCGAHTLGWLTENP